MEASAGSSQIFALVILPILIFLARIIDVSLQTLRIIFISKNFKLLAPIIGFFEVLVWLTAITQIMRNLNNPVCYIAYALGFSAGTYVGLRLEERLSLGKVIVRIFIREDQGQLITALRENGYGLTVFDARGGKDKVLLLFSIIDREKLDELEGFLGKFAPEAFFSVEDIRQCHGGYFKSSLNSGRNLRYMLFQKK
jgi:uncharacterized protein YebE (UPF0316 family)